MDFRYTEEQLALQDTLQRFIARDYDFERRRALARSPLGYSAEAWKQYAELGLLALPFPEEFGGLGGTGVDIMVVMELIGQGLLLEPYLSTVVLCGGLIRDAASDSVKKAMLPQIAAGKLQLALAAYEAAGRYDLAHVACTRRQKRRRLASDGPQGGGARCPVGRLFSGVGAQQRRCSRCGGHLAVSGPARRPGLTPASRIPLSPAAAPPICSSQTSSVAACLDRRAGASARASLSGRWTQALPRCAPRPWVS